MRNISDKYCGENRNMHITFNRFLEVMLFMR